MKPWMVAMMFVVLAGAGAAAFFFLKKKQQPGAAPEAVSVSPAGRTAFAVAPAAPAPKPKKKKKKRSLFGSIGAAIGGVAKTAVKLGAKAATGGLL